MRYFILKYTMGFILLISNSAFATTLNISNVPLYLGGSIEPNIMFTLDDSGSMQWEVTVSYTHLTLPTSDLV